MHIDRERVLTNSKKEYDMAGELESLKDIITDWLGAKTDAERETVMTRMQAAYVAYCNAMCREGKYNHPSLGTVFKACVGG